MLRHILHIQRTFSDGQDQFNMFFVSCQATLDLTDSQRDDLLYLRQLLHCKQGQLARERRALLEKMACSHVEHMDNATKKLSELNQWAEQLRSNGAAEYRVNMEFNSAYWAGVRADPAHICFYPHTQ